MKTAVNNRRLSLRFTKWSRKSYAAFKSVGRHVTIGRLKNVIADALLGKQTNILSIFTTAWKQENESNENEWSQPPDEELLLELCSFSLSQNTKIDCSFIKPQCTNIFSWLKAVVHNAFSFFYSLPGKMDFINAKDRVIQQQNFY